MPRKKTATGDPILDTLRAERERRGWSQTYLAQRLGRQTYNTPYNWESGVNEPTLSSLREWAGALGYDVTLTLQAGTPTGRVHCEHWLEGDGSCCRCGEPNWCPDEGATAAAEKRFEQRKYCARAERDGGAA